LSHEASFGETIECILFRTRANKNINWVLLSAVTWITMSTKVLDGIVDVNETNKAGGVSRKNDWNTFKCKND
jgi:hypothetical protein